MMVYPSVRLVALILLPYNTGQLLKCHKLIFWSTNLMAILDFKFRAGGAGEAPSWSAIVWHGCE